MFYKASENASVVTLEFKIDLPDSLAQEAKTAGLLTPERVKEWLQTELRQRRINCLFESANRLASLPEAGDIRGSRNENPGDSR